MYSRVSQFSFNADQLDQMVSRLEDIGKQLESIDGMIDTYVLWDTSGNGMSVAVYRDKEAADAAMPTIQSVWGGIMDLLTGPPKPAEYSGVWNIRG